MSWSRRQLAERVDVLAAEHEGDAFVAAIQALAAKLAEDEREVLGEVLVERASEHGDLDYGLIRSVDEPRWKLFGRPPRDLGQR